MRRQITPANISGNMRQVRPILDDLQDDQHVDERIISQLTGLSLSRVRKQRLLKKGPPWIKVGKAVRYPVRGLRGWLTTLQQHPASDSTIHRGFRDGVQP